jgi:2'-5' RNA ligase
MKSYIKLFEEFIALNEKSGEHPFGCSMVYFSFPEIFKIQDAINPDDLNETGLEDEPHVTLLYGIHDGGDHKELNKETLDKVLDYSKPALSQPIILKKVSAFENENQDVLIFDVEKKDELVNANKNLSSLPNSNQFPDYHPHCTIAYLKPGTAKKYIDKFKDIKDIEVKPSKIVYSRPSGEKITQESNVAIDLDEDFNLEVALAEMESYPVNEVIDTIANAIASAAAAIKNAINKKREAAESIKKTEEQKKNSQETLAKQKEKASKTPDKDRAAVYDAKAKEESVKQAMFDAKKRYQEAKIAVADAKATTAAAKQKAAQAKAK